MLQEGLTEQYELMQRDEFDQETFAQQLQGSFQGIEFDSSPPLNPKFQQSNPTSQSIQDRCGKLLSQLGWGSGVRIPFANDENQALEKTLDLKQRKILELQSELTDNTEHAESLDRGIGLIEEDIQCVRRLLNNKVHIFEGEKTLFSNAERMLTNTLREKSIYEKSLQECQRRCYVIQKDMDHRLSKVLELRDQIEFDSEALKEYHERLRVFNEISSDVTRLNEEDCKSIRELEDAKVDLGAKRKELRHQLDFEAMNTAKYQEQFDRLCIEFRKVHRQRLDMIAMWTTTIQAMGDKDADMKDVADEYFEAKKQFRNIGESILENERRLKMESCGIRGTELHLSELDRKLGEIRQRMNEEKEVVAMMKDSCLLCQVEVQSAYNQMKSSMEAYTKLEAELKLAHKKTKKALMLVQELSEKLKELELGRSDATTRTAELERILDREEEVHEKLIQEMDIIKQRFWEQSNSKTSAYAQMSLFDTTISRVRTHLETCYSNEISNLDYVAKRSGTIYRLDLECSVLENRINRMTNQQIDPKYFVMQNTLRELREVEKAVVKDRKFISFELEHTRRMYSKCNYDLGKYRNELASLEAQLQQCDMNTHGLEKIMVQSIQEMNNEMVKQSLERVFLKRLVEAMGSEKQHMFGLAEIRNTIYWAVKERKAEIENHKSLNLSRQKALNVAISKMRVQQGEVETRTCVLKGRFDMMTKLMAASESSDPEKQSLTYQIKKCAREREVLETEVEVWKARVAQAEKELEGLMNVYQIMNASNSSLKDSLSPAEESSVEMQELELLTGQAEEIVLRRNRASKDRQILRDRIEDLSQQIGNKEQDLRGTIQLLRVKEMLSTKLDHEQTRQREKIDRWSAMCHKLLREIKSTLPKDQGELMQWDLKLRLTMTKLDSAIVMLQRLVAQHQQVAPTVYHLLHGVGLSHLMHYKPSKFGATFHESKPGSSDMASTFSAYSASPGTEMGTRDSHTDNMDSNASRGSATRSAPSAGVRNVPRMRPISRLESRVTKSKFDAFGQGGRESERGRESRDPRRTRRGNT